MIENIDDDFSYLKESDENSLQKEFDGISSLSSGIKNFHYCCQVCFCFPRIEIIDDEKIKLICECNNSKKPISITSAFNHMNCIDKKIKIDSKLKCEENEKYEKFLYYCLLCKEYKCSKCFLECLEQEHKLIDLNREEIKTKKKRNYIEFKLNQIYEYFREKKIDDICEDKDNKDNTNSFLIEKIKIIPNDRDKTKFYKKEIENHSFLRQIKEEKELTLLHIIRIIISDYDEYPNFQHKENISYLEKYMNYKYGMKNGKHNKMVLEYELIDNSDMIKVFGITFVNINKEKCFLFINNKILELNENINIKDIFNEKNNNNLLKIGKIKIELIEKENNKITNMSNIFNGISTLLPSSDLSTFDTSNITDMSYMFSNCTTLQSLPEIPKWNTNKVTNMNFLFGNCSSLKFLPDKISEWDTSNVRTMNNMFFGCASLISLPDISKWTTSNVIDINAIFSNCSSLIDLPDISQWDTTNVQLMSKIVYECNSLKSLPNINSKWNFDKVKNKNEILEGSPFKIIIEGNRCKKYYIMIKNFFLSIEFLLYLSICFYIILLLISIGLIYKKLYFSFDLDYEKYLLNDPVFYDFFTSINGNIEFQKDKRNLEYINIPFLFINFIQIMNIFTKCFKNLKAKNFVIFSFIMNTISIILLFFDLSICFRLTDSFHHYIIMVDCYMYSQYKKNNTNNTYNGAYSDIYNNIYNDTYNNTYKDIFEDIYNYPLIYKDESFVNLIMMLSFKFMCFYLYNYYLIIKIYKKKMKENKNKFNKNLKSIKNTRSENNLIKGNGKYNKSLITLNDNLIEEENENIN